MNQFEEMKTHPQLKEFTPEYFSEMGQIRYSNIYRLCTPEQKKRSFCVTCGADISLQAEKKYCTSHYAGDKLAHQCRNGKTKPFHNTLRGIDTVLSYPALFPAEDFLQIPEDKERLILEYEGNSELLKKEFIQKYISALRKKDFSIKLIIKKTS